MRGDAFRSWDFFLLYIYVSYAWCYALAWVRCLHVPHTCRCCSRFNAGYYTSQLTSPAPPSHDKICFFFLCETHTKGVNWMNERTNERWRKHCFSSVSLKLLFNYVLTCAINGTYLSTYPPHVKRMHLCLHNGIDIVLLVCSLVFLSCFAYIFFYYYGKFILFWYECRVQCRSY